MAEMEEFLSNIKILVNTLGYKVFDELRNKNIESKEDIFFIKTTRGGAGVGKPVSDGFLIFKDSKITDSLTSSYPSGMAKLRDKLLKEKIIIYENDDLLFSKDYLVASSSTAAMIIMGRSANGLTEWKLEDGTSLKEVEENL